MIESEAQEPTETQGVYQIDRMKFPDFSRLYFFKLMFPKIEWWLEKSKQIHNEENIEAQDS